MAGDWSVDHDADADLAVRVLSNDRAWSAYALGDLEPPFAQYTTVAVASAGGRAAACLTLRHPAFTVIVSAGEPAGVSAILEQADLPPHVFLSIPVEHREEFARHFDFQDGLTAMRRMALREKLAGDLDGCERLSTAAAEELLELYGAYPGSAFHPDHLVGRVFFGTREHGEMVAAAGTHIVSQRFDVAAVGNVFTRPDFRGRGLGERLTRAVAHQLQAEGIGLIVLNVAVENAGAARIYERLGFRDHCRFLEGVATRR